MSVVGQPSFAAEAPAGLEPTLDAEELEAKFDVRRSFVQEAGARSFGCATGTQAVVFSYESGVLEPGET